MPSNALLPVLCQSLDRISDIIQLYQSLEKTARAHDDAPVLKRLALAEDYREELVPKVEAQQAMIQRLAAAGASDRKTLPILTAMLDCTGRLCAEYRSAMAFARDQGHPDVALHAELILERAQVIGDEAETRLKEFQLKQALPPKRRRRKGFFNSMVDMFF